MSTTANISSEPAAAPLRGRTKLARRLVRQLQALLPSRVYDRLIRVLLVVNNGAIRWTRLAKGLLLQSWRDPEAWARTRRVHRVLPYTLVGVGGLEATDRMARMIVGESIPGDFVELGVARGGCAALLGSALFENSQAAAERRRLWLFDSFEGLPAPTDEDYAGEGEEKSTGVHIRPLGIGDCLGTLEEVQDLLLRRFRYPTERVRFVKGWFQDTIPTVRDEIGPIAVLRMDGDWYESTRTCLEGLYDRVVPGGVVIVDDYQSCFGCERAVSEFLGARKLEVDMHLDGRGGSYFRKPA
jgi:O-methyltransferase